MAQANAVAPLLRRRGGSRWWSPLVAGVCFGLTYGATHRLFSLNVGDWGGSRQGFDVQPFPGTSLESLKLRFGAPEAEIRADLERQELERQQAAQDKAKPLPPAVPEAPAAPAPTDGPAPEPAELPASEAPTLTPPPVPPDPAPGQP
jgi:hypothetical protein